MKTQTGKTIAVAVMLSVVVASVWIKIADDRAFEATLKESQRLSDELNEAMRKDFESEMRAIRTGQHD